MFPLAPHSRSIPMATIFGVRRNLSPPSVCANLVLVETDDALLLCSRDRSQDVGRIVKWLEEQRIRRLL